MKQVASKAVELETTKVSQLGGKSNYLFVVLNLLLSWLGFALVLAALSALQHYINKSGDAGAFAQNADYPNLKAVRLLRFDWYIIFFNFIVLGLVTLAILGANVRQARVTLIGYLSVATTLAMISTDRMYNISYFRSGSEFSSSRCAFAGYVILCIGNLGLMYLLGLQPEFF